MSVTHRAMRASKQLLRKQLKANLKQMDTQEKIDQSRIITEKLLSMDVYKESTSLSLYLSMPSEVITNEILTDVFKNNKKCYIPHYVGDTMKMVLLKDQNDYDTLPLTSWNIKQPSDDEIRECALDRGGLDLIVVPGLGFTLNGLRLGRGKGYYDNYFRKYFQAFQKKPITIGLAYKCQIVDELPTDEFDENLDFVLSI